MAIGKAWTVTVGLLLLSGWPTASAVESPETVIFSGSVDLDRLVIVEARQQKRRILSLIPAGIFLRPFSFIVAQKHLKDKEQIHGGTSEFVTALAEFSSPRLAIYSDKNPCIKGDTPLEADVAKKPTVSVAGIPYLKAGVGATVTFDILNLKGKSWANGVKSFSPADRATLKTLAADGFGVVHVVFSPGPDAAKNLQLQQSLQIAWESNTEHQSSLVNGKKAYLVERFYLGSETIDSVPAGMGAQFPTGIELPHEAATLFPLIYRDWQTSVLAKHDLIRSYSGPVNRCEICYDRPPPEEQLRQAGVFWTTASEPQLRLGLRVQSKAGTSETYLSRHLFKKSSGKQLLISTVAEKASVKNSFVEQGSVQKPFLGEIFCPAMDGYQKMLTERREKTISALNELSGWNEQKLSSAGEEVGVGRASWYQEHFQNK